MKKKMRFIFSSLTMMTLMVGILLSGHTEMGHVNAAVTTQCTTYSGSNINAQNYPYNWSTTVKSYLTATNDGYMRVQSNASTNGYLVEYYDADYNFQKSKVIPVELPIWGAFYETEDNYYILSGQSNSNESDEIEVYRITQYDKHWNRIKSCGLKGANTYIPFAAGSARMAHSGNQLVILTCHEMYASSDGAHHQASVTIQVDISKMEVTDSFTGVLNISKGYVSHSFNQFVDIDNNHIIGVHHGDAYPRSIVLVNYPADISSGKFTSTTCIGHDLVTFEGAIGANYTGATIGGFAISTSSYIVAGNQDITAGNTSGGRNIFVVSQNKTTGTITRNDITNYAEGDGASTPQLVTLSANRYLLLWNKKGITYYTELNGTGTPIGKTYSLEGELSDCVPIVANGKVVWYTWKNGDITFYEINTSDLSMSNSVLIENGHKYEFSEVDANGMITRKCTQCEDSSKFTAPTTFTLYWCKNTYGTASYAPNPRHAVGDSYYAWIYDLDGDKDVQEMEFISSNPEVVSTEHYSYTKEKFNMNSPGIVQITARLKYNPSAKVNTYTFRVGEDGDVSLSDCTFDIDEYYSYKGKAVEPTFTLTYKGQPLVKNTDYTVEYSNNTAIGTGTVIITGKGLFSGTISKEFNIVDTMLEDCDIILSQDTYIFSGSEKEPTITIKQGTTTIAESRYSYTIIDNIYPGTATVTITGSDSLPGIITKNFEIIPCNLANSSITIDELADELIYDGTKKTPEVTIYNADGDMVSPDSYNLSYENNINAGTATVTVSTKDEYSDYITGALKGTFTIQKAVPEIGIVKVTSPETIYTSTAPSIVELSKSDDTIPGILSLVADEFLYGETEYNYIFKPDDSDNYEEIIGTISIKALKDVLTELEVEGIVERTEYYYGDSFDMSGITVVAHFESGAQLDVTNLVQIPALAVGDTEITLSYTNVDITKTYVLTGIIVRKKPISVEHLYWNVTGSPYTYDGKKHGVIFTGEIPEGISVQLTENEAVKSGVYMAKAVLSLAEGYDAGNYEIIGNTVITAEWSIIEEQKTEEKDKEASEDESKELPKPNTTVTDTKTGVSYKVTKSDAANGTVEYIGAGKSAKGTVSIPATVNLNGISYKVTSIAKDAFKGNKSITKVTVGKNISTIGKNAFSGCTKLKTVTLGSNVTKIDEKAFYNCKALKKITIPAKVNKIGKSAFANCKNLKTITIKTTKLNKSKVGSNAFKGIAANSTIKVPAKKLSEYKKILLARGVGKKAKIKK